MRDITHGFLSGRATDSCSRSPFSCAGPPPCPAIGGLNCASCCCARRRDGGGCEASRLPERWRKSSTKRDGTGQRRSRSGMTRSPCAGGLALRCPSIKVSLVLSWRDPRRLEQSSHMRLRDRRRVTQLHLTAQRCNISASRFASRGNDLQRTLTMGSMSPPRWLAKLNRIALSFICRHASRAVLEHFGGPSRPKACLPRCRRRPPFAFWRLGRRNREVGVISGHASALSPYRSLIKSQKSP